MKLRIRTASHASPWLVLALFGVLALAGLVAVWGCESQQPGVLDIQATEAQSAAARAQKGQLFDPTDAMTEAIQDEYHAQYTYSRVLDDLGDIGPFNNIVEAEINHVAAISVLFSTREWETPESEWTLDNVVTFATRVEACIGGVGAELENIAMYDGLLELELPPDVREVFSNLRAASYDQHLPAFEACSVPGPIDAMEVAIQDEYHAEATYAKVLGDLGEITPFNTIVLAEIQHVTSMAGLYDARELPIPVSQWNEANVNAFESRTEACAGGVEGELENIGMYDDLLELPDLPSDVFNVFENLRAASLYHHLPAFTVCATVVHQPSEYLLTAIQHEYKLNALYAKVLDDLGEIDPFANIVSAEAQHVSELAAFIEKKGGEVPASQWNETNVPSFSGKGEACTRALAEEIVNRAMYDGFLLEPGLAPDVKEVLERLRATTDQSHIPAFSACAL